MDERIDRRAARTRKALHLALLSLILRKGYEATTIQDIVDEANVGRSTFYDHYTGKEDLLRGGFQNLRKELAEMQRAARVRSAGSPGEPIGFSLAMFEHALKYTDVYRALVGGRGGAVALAQIRQVLMDLVRKELSAAWAGDVASRELAVQFVVGAFLSVLTWWLERKPRLQPAEVDGIFRRLAFDGLTPSLRVKFRR